MTAKGTLVRPNILLIAVDDMGYSDIGPFGSEINTPAIEALVAEGLKFTNFYVGQPEYEDHLNDSVISLVTWPGNGILRMKRIRGHTSAGLSGAGNSGLLHYRPPMMSRCHAR